MTNSNLMATNTPENHISAAEMFQYLEGHLPPAARHTVELHLVDCPFCAEAMEGLATTTPSQASHTLFDINRQLKSRTQRRKKNKSLDFIKDWGLATTILLALLVIAILGWYQAKLSGQSKTQVISKNQTQEQSVTPVGGWASLHRYVNTAIQNSSLLRASVIPTELAVQVTVAPDSTLTQIKLLKKLDANLNAEIIRILQNGPKWIPAKRNGSAISSVQTVTLLIPEE